MNTRIVIALGAVLTAGALAAQPLPLSLETPFQVNTMQGENGVFFHYELSGMGEAVKNAPYSAQSTTEFTQTLPDGNHIRRTQTGMVYRDSEGRTRREQTIGPIGALPGPAPKQMIFISDPVAGVSYMLDPDHKIARKMPMPKGGQAAAVSTGMITVNPGGAGVAQGATGEKTMRHVEIIQHAGKPVEAGAAMWIPHAAQATNSSRTSSKLGSKMFDTVEADGTRSLMTIPAGQVGNEKPIEVTDERWFSPQLQLVVMTKHSDPRMGDSVYQLSNISLEEPAPGLFQPPADYQVSEGDVRFGVKTK